MSRAQISNSFLPTIITIVYLILGFWFITNHEMWRDEMQVWSIAAGSNSLVNLFEHAAYEGSPSLWFIIVFLVTRFTDNPLGMQIAHMLIAGTVVWIFLRYAPFSIFQKLLFISGYFICYEYSVISRSYGLTVLLVFATCALFPLRKTHFTSILIVLALLVQTNVFGVILAISLLGTMAVERWREKDLSNVLSQKDVVAGILLFTASLIFSIYDMLPLADSSLPLASDSANIAQALSVIWKSYVPIPALRMEFWDTNIVMSPAVQIIGSALLLLFFSVSLTRKPLALLFFLISSFGMVLFFLTKYIGSVRHYGFLFISLIAALWIAHYVAEKETPFDFTKKLLAPVFLTILILQIVAAAFAIKTDLQHPFSNAKKVADYINQEKLDNLFIAGRMEHTASAVAGFLGRKIYYFRGGRMGTYLLSKSTNAYNPQNDFVRLAEKLRNDKNQDILIISSIPTNDFEEFESLPEDWQLLEEFRGAILPDENFAIYFLPKPN